METAWCIKQQSLDLQSQRKSWVGVVIHLEAWTLGSKNGVSLG